MVKLRQLNMTEKERNALRYGCAGFVLYVCVFLMMQFQKRTSTDMVNVAAAPK